MHNKLFSTSLNPLGTAVPERYLLYIPCTGLSLNFHTLLKTIAILGRKVLPLPNLGLNLSKGHYLELVKLEVARVPGY